MTDILATLLGETSSTQTALFGATIPTNFSTVTDPAAGTIDLLHDWIANSSGVYEAYNIGTTTLTNIGAEWQADLALVLAGKAVTPVQRLEANAEILFQSTKLTALPAAQLTRDEEDVQREIDAIDGAMKIVAKNDSSYNPANAFTKEGYMEVERALQGNAVLQELALQGHGVNDPTSVRYDGYYNDFASGVASSTFYIGGGLGNNLNALGNFAATSILTDMVFPYAEVNGVLEQLDQNGNVATSLAKAVVAVDDAMYGRSYTAADFASATSTLNNKYVSGEQAYYNSTATIAVPAGDMNSLFGLPVPKKLAAIQVTPTQSVALEHVWIADGTGLYEAYTSTGTLVNLAVEWKTYYDDMLAGNGASLTAEQRMEGNAEAIFENTSLSKLSAIVQERDREDAQREFDAIGAVMLINQITLGINPASWFTDSSYQALARTLQNNAALEQLAIEGHGLNNPPTTSGEYAGFTNDFQNNTDQTILYIGGGADTGETVVTNYFDDNVMSHSPFPLIAQNGGLEQLDQNAAAEDSLAVVVAGLNQTAFQLVLTPADFYNPDPTTAAGTQLTATGAVIATSLNSVTTGINPSATEAKAVTVALQHTWIADSSGLYEAYDAATGTVPADLNAEWNAAAAAVAKGTATPIQRLEADAQVLFEHTGLANVSLYNQEVDREDVQRMIDVLAAARQIDAVIDPGTSATSVLTEASYEDLQHTIADSPVLAELALQGVGTNELSASRYAGYTRDFQTGVDGKTLYIGGGLDNNASALGVFFGDAILSYVAFPTVMDAGVPEQMNQNGGDDTSVEQSVLALDDSLFGPTLKAADFATKASTANDGFVSPYTATYLAALNATAPTGEMLSAYGADISSSFGSITLADGTVIQAPHDWIADSTGLFHAYTVSGATVVAANLATEWQADYTQMLAGSGSSLTFLQRLEGNAQAVFLNTALNKLPAATQARDREDVQRELDAVYMAAEIVEHDLGISFTTGITPGQYLLIEQTLQSTPVLEEMAMQGQGVYGPSSARYNGYTNDMKWSDWQSSKIVPVDYVGGGFETGDDAIEAILGDGIMTQMEAPVIALWGSEQQLNGNGNEIEDAGTAAEALNNLAFNETLVAADFAAT